MIFFSPLTMITLLRTYSAGNPFLMLGKVVVVTDVCVGYPADSL